ncbi:MAG TPA: T9SS type A sorting domain-containing protein [Chitinophagaceae bacterium]|nr:T9SS type A sorting domain-containing protein [Chitinophagaceae bacterium]
MAKGSNSVYSFTDDVSSLDLNGTKIYYRLKMVDIDASAEYSDIRAVSFNQQSNATTIKSFPNPATSSVYITSAGISSTVPVKAAIYDMQGRVVKSFSNATMNGLNTIVLSVDGMAKGQYIITINGTNGQEHTVITKE